MSDFEIIQINTQTGYVKLKCFLNDTIDDIIEKSLNGEHDCTYFGIQTEDYRSRNIACGKKRFLCPRLSWCHLKLLLGGEEIYLTIRNYPSNIDDLLKSSLLTCEYLINELIEQYCLLMPEIKNLETGLELSCLIHYKLLKSTFSAKNAVDLKSLFPPVVIESIKLKNLKKLTQPKVAEIENLGKQEYLRRLYVAFQKVCPFDQDEFKCFYGSGEGIPVTVVIGPRVNICIKVGSTENRVVGYFAKIESIQVHIIQEGQFAQVKLYNWSEKDPLVFTFSDIIEADNFVHLIDAYTGYDKMRSNCALFLSKCSDDFVVITEIDKSRVKREKIMDSGQFGDVYKGTYKQSNEDMVVAIKMCKADSTEEVRKEILKEAEIMKMVEHPHIVQIIGIAQGQEIWIVMEYCQEGQLLSYLIDNRCHVNEIELLTMCYQLATAMSFLESKSVVHRDIAARNVLLANFECVKLSDFGKAQFLGENEYYVGIQNEMLPVKWAAMESLMYRRFNSASDVWGFGVLMWEVMSRGRKPYADINNIDVLSILKDRKRLPRLPNIPDSLHSLMMACWIEDPKKRPNFSNIKNKINDIKVEIKKMIADEHAVSMVSGLDRKPPQKPRFGSGTASHYNQYRQKPTNYNSSNPAINQSMPDLLLSNHNLGAVGGGGAVCDHRSSQYPSATGGRVPTQAGGLTHRYQQNAATTNTGASYRRNMSTVIMPGAPIVGSRVDSSLSNFGRSGSQDSATNRMTMTSTRSSNFFPDELEEYADNFRFKIRSFIDTVSLSQSCSVLQLKGFGLAMRHFLQEIELQIPSHPVDHILSEKESVLIKLFKSLIRVRIESDAAFPSNTNLSTSDPIITENRAIMIEKMLRICSAMLQQVDLLMKSVFEFLTNQN